MRTHRGPTPKQRRETEQRQSLNWAKRLGHAGNVNARARNRLNRIAAMDAILERNCHD